MREKLASLGEKKSVYEVLLIFDLCYILFLLRFYQPSVRNFILFCIPWLIQYELLWPKISALRKQEDSRYDRYWNMSWLVLFCLRDPALSGNKRDSRLPPGLETAHRFQHVSGRTAAPGCVYPV